MFFHPSISDQRSSPVWKVSLAGDAFVNGFHAIAMARSSDAIEHMLRCGDDVALMDEALAKLDFHTGDGGERAGAAAPTSAANYGRRSPIPMINILRTPQVKAAQKGLPTGLVYSQNEETLGDIGTEKLEEMLRTLDWSAVNDVKVDRSQVEVLKIARKMMAQGGGIKATDDLTLTGGEAAAASAAATEKAAESDIVVADWASAVDGASGNGLLLQHEDGRDVVGLAAGIGGNRVTPPRHRNISATALGDRVREIPSQPHASSPVLGLGPAPRFSRGWWRRRRFRRARRRDRGGVVRRKVRDAILVRAAPEARRVAFETRGSGWIRPSRPFGAEARDARRHRRPAHPSGAQYAVRGLAWEARIRTRRPRVRWIFDGWSWPRAASRADRRSWTDGELVRDRRASRARGSYVAPHAAQVAMRAGPTATLAPAPRSAALVAARMRGTQRPRRRRWLFLRSRRPRTHETGRRWRLGWRARSQAAWASRSRRLSRCPLPPHRRRRSRV